MTLSNTRIALITGANKGVVFAQQDQHRRRATYFRYEFLRHRGGDLESKLHAGTAR
jgi:hypothetical protein